MDWKGTVKTNTPYVHIWMKLCQIKSIYPVDAKNVKVTMEELKIEDDERWVEVPDDYLNNYRLKLRNIVFDFIVIERKQEDNTWPRAKGDDWRETLQTGDIIDACDTKGNWYEALVRFVYPKDRGKWMSRLVNGPSNEMACGIHYIGWNAKWDDEIELGNAERLAKRHSHTTGPHRPRKRQNDNIVYIAK